MLFEFSIVLIITLLISLFFVKLKIPLIASYLISGILLGELSRYILKDSNALFSVANVGVILLMFAIGLEFSLKRILGFKSYLWRLTMLQILISAMVLTILLLLFKFPINLAIFMGILFSFSSTVIVAKILTASGMVHTQVGEISMSILLLQDLIILPISLFLPFAFASKGINVTLVTDLLFALFKSGIIFALVFLFAKKIIPLVLKKIVSFSQPDLLLISIVCFSLFFSSLSEKLGFSLAIGAYVAGLIISSTSEKHAVFSEIRPLRDIFSIVFFIYLGFSVDLPFIFINFFKIISISFVIILVKWIVLYVLLRKFDIYKKNAIQVATNLSQVSEFAFILSSLYLNKGLLQENDYKLIVPVTIVTIIISPFFINYVKNIVKKISFLDPDEKREFVFSDNIKLTHHAVLCGYGRIGKQIVRQLLLNNIPFVVIDDNKTEIEKLKNKGINALYGDATEIELLNFANTKEAKIVLVAIPDRFSEELIISHVRRLNPQTIIYGRVHEEEDKKYLYALGVRYVLFPEFEGALTISKKILKTFGVSNEQISNSINQSYYDEKIV